MCIVMRDKRWLDVDGSLCRRFERGMLGLNMALLLGFACTKVLLLNSLSSLVQSHMMSCDVHTRCTATCQTGASTGRASTHLGRFPLVCEACQEVLRWYRTFVVRTAHGGANSAYYLRACVCHFLDVKF